MTFTENEEIDVVNKNRIPIIIRKKVLNIIIEKFFIHEEEETILNILDDIWNLQSKPSIYQEENIYLELHRHYVRFYDIDLNSVFKDYLNIFNTSDKEFIKFIEHIFSPNYYAEKYENIQECDFFNEIITYFKKCNFKLHPTEAISGYPLFTVLHLDSTIDNMINSSGIIFAAQFKPTMQLHNINTNIEQLQIDTSDPNQYLLYNSGNQKELITWNELNSWYAKTKYINSIEGIPVSLKERCENSLSNLFEKFFFNSYFELYEDKLGDSLPALFPQVYLNFDTKNNNKQNKINQKMDFILCLSNGKRIIIELDGYQHYAEKINFLNGNYEYKFAPKNYAEMVSFDRKLRLDGYDIYRFGGLEYYSDPLLFKNIMQEFFDTLFQKYNVKL